MNQPEVLLDPLDAFYLDLNLPVPEAKAMEGSQVPAPYRTLLVHQNDMTPTLERVFGQRIVLRLLRRKILPDLLLRQVTLILKESERPVEFGAIRIHLNRLPEPARPLILRGELPLGRILHDFSILHTSEPIAFFCLQPDSVITEALHLTAPLQPLFGRRNHLLLPSGDSIAEVIEVLPSNCAPSS